MKLIIFTIIMFLTASIAAKAFDYETSRGRVNKMEEKKKGENNFNPMDLLQVILKDPEFLQLDSRKQLSVLFAIYNILENRFNKKI